MTDKDGVTGRPDSPGLRLAIDYVPLVLFFAVNFLFPGDVARRLVGSVTGSLGQLGQVEAFLVAKVLVATVVFVVATIAAIVVSRFRLGSVSPMLWISGVLVVVFGGLTLYFHDPRFIQMKPTFVYAIFAGVLGFGLATGRPLLEQLLCAAYPGLTAIGWRKLTLNWTLFFAGMAVLNEIVRAAASFDFWLGFKVWGVIPLTLLFALGNIPMLLRHGLTVEDGVAEKELPPE